MIKIYFSILTILSAFIINGCSSTSPDTVAYNCTLPCLGDAPTLSTSTIPSSTGGIIDVTLNFSGDITNINRVNISLRDINSGTSAGSSLIFTPTTQSLTETITIASGTPVSSYYPFVIIYTNANTNTNITSTRYYRESTISTSQYTYYEILNNNPSQFMLSLYTIPLLQIN